MKVKFHILHKVHKFVCYNFHQFITSGQKHAGTFFMISIKWSFPFCCSSLVSLQLQSRWKFISVNLLLYSECTLFILCWTSFIAKLSFDVFFPLIQYGITLLCQSMLFDYCRVLLDNLSCVSILWSSLPKFFSQFPLPHLALSFIPRICSIIHDCIHPEICCQ